MDQRGGAPLDLNRQAARIEASNSIIPKRFPSAHQTIASKEGVTETVDVVFSVAAITAHHETTVIRRAMGAGPALRHTHTHHTSSTMH